MFARATLLAMALLVPATSFAQTAEDRDLDLIPQKLPDEESQASKKTPPERVHYKLYASNALTSAARREVDVPFQPPLPYDYQNRTSLDATLTWSAAPRLSLTLSDRADVIEQEGVPVWSGQTIRNALREGYVLWEPFTRAYLEAGRINVRNGTALGFNPTDFLRPRTLIGQASLDPSVLRLNRLGTVMIRAQKIWNSGSASVLYAPKLFSPSAITTDAIGIDPRIDATNAAHRGLAEVSSSFGDLSAQALVYLEPRRSKLGLNLTHPIGDSAIAYVEWTGGFEENLIARAIDYGRETGTLPAGATPPIPTDSSRAFRNDLAAGASWTIAASLTLNLEYHLHQGGLSRADWDHWFSAGLAAPARAGELWYIRGYANDQLEPAAMHQIFVRVDWPKALVDHLEITGFAFVSLLDASILSQITASYYLSNAWTVGLSLGGNLGGARSERGSFPQAASGIVELILYL
jgi:hypothetical protein